MLYISLHPMNAESKYISLPCLLEKYCIQWNEINWPILSVAFLSLWSMKIIKYPHWKYWIPCKPSINHWQKKMTRNFIWKTQVYTQAISTTIFIDIYLWTRFIFSRWRHAVCRFFLQTCFAKKSNMLFCGIERSTNSSLNIKKKVTYCQPKYYSSCRFYLYYRRWRKWMI